MDHRWITWRKKVRKSLGNLPRKVKNKRCPAFQPWLPTTQLELRNSHVFQSHKLFKYLFYFKSHNDIFHAPSWLLPSTFSSNKLPQVIKLFMKSYREELTFPFFLHLDESFYYFILFILWGIFELVDHQHHDT